MHPPNIKSSTIEKQQDIIEQVTRYPELVEQIRQLKNKKSPGYDRINGTILKHLPKVAITKLLYIINASFRLPAIWKVAEIIMIPKPGKPPTEVSSYRPISLLPILSKIFEKLLLKRLKPIKAYEENNVCSTYFIRMIFRNQHRHKWLHSQMTLLY